MRALSFSGGGVRGIMSAVWLSEIVKQLSASHERPVDVRKHVHILSGTSTGAILAALLAVGKNPYEIIELYVDLCAEVFPPQPRWTGPTFRRIFRGHLYNPGPLESHLYTHLGNVEFGEIDTLLDLQIASYDLNASRLFSFSKRTTPHVRLRDACAASAAAPTYLPKRKVWLDASTSRYFSDGGLTRNNPTGLAFSAGATTIVSLGTGTAQSLRTNEDLEGWWGVDRIANVIPQAMDNAEKTVTHFTRNASRLGIKFLHMDTPLTAASPKLDDASKRNMDLLISQAEEKIEDELQRGSGDQFALAAKLLE